MRRVMRGLVRLIPVKRRGVVYTDFEDELGELTPAELKGIDVGTNRSTFERKVRTYLRSHEHDIVVQKPRPSAVLGAVVTLATSGGVSPGGLLESPRFFSGFLGHAEQAAVALRLCARIARTRFYVPPGISRPCCGRRIRW